MAAEFSWKSFGVCVVRNSEEKRRAGVHYVTAWLRFNPQKPLCETQPIWKRWFTPSLSHWFLDLQSRNNKQPWQGEGKKTQWVAKQEEFTETHSVVFSSGDWGLFWYEHLEIYLVDICGVRGINCGKVGWGGFRQREHRGGANRPWSRNHVSQGEVEGKERKPRPGPESGALSGLGRAVGDISQIRMDHKPLDAIQFCGATIRRLITCHPSIRPPLRRCLPSHKSTHDKMTFPPTKTPHSPPLSWPPRLTRALHSQWGGGLQGEKVKKGD